MNNCLFFQMLSYSRTIAVMGYQLKAISIHIQGNMTDFLRKIAQMKAKLPSCIQIDIKNVSTKQSTINLDTFPHSELTTGLFSDKTEFQFQIFISRHITQVSLKKMQNLNIKMQELSNFLELLFTQEFPHFQFTQLKDTALLQAICPNPTPQFYTYENYLVNFRKYHFWNSGKYKLLITLTIFNSVILFLWIATNLSGWNLVINLVLLLESIGILIAEEARFSHFNSTNFHQVNLWWPYEIFLNKESTENLLIFFDQNLKKIIVSQFFGWSQYFRAFRFNQVKFYRTLIQQYVNSNLSLNIQYYFQRVIPQELKKFQKSIKNKQKLQYLIDSKIITSFERTNAGFYKFFPIFSLHTEIDGEISQESIEKIKNEANANRNQIIQILESHFPNSQISLLKPQAVLAHTTIKSTASRKYKAAPMEFFTIGKNLQNLIQIPEEIHKYLPLYYAGEFSTPLLNDAIVFGHTFNSENFSQEITGGLSHEELMFNILFAGDFYRMTHMAVIRTVTELIKHDYPVIIFDWEGTWKNLYPIIQNNQIPANKFQYLTVGDEIGLQSFQLSNPARGDAQIEYVTRIITILQNLFRYSTHDLELFRSILLNEDCGDLMHMKANFPKLLEDKGNKLSYYKTPVFALLSMLTQDIYLDIFGRDITQYCHPWEIFQSTNVWIINLMPIRNTQLKALFIHLFLAQLLSFYNNSGIPDEILPQFTKKSPVISVIPHGEFVFPKSSDHHKVDSIAEILIHLNEAQFPVIMETNQINRLDPEIFSVFETIFGFRTSKYQNQKTLSNLLHLDSQFVNTTHKKYRKVSYQHQFLSHLDWNHTIIFRPNYQHPFVFSFDYQEKNFQLINKKFYGNSLNLTIPRKKMNLKQDTELNKYKTVIAGDFPEFGFLHPYLILFLEKCVDLNNSVPYVSEPFLREMLSDLIMPVFEQENWANIQKRYKKIKEILVQFIDKGYFKANNLQIENIPDAHQYKITPFAQKVIKNWKENQEDTNKPPKSQNRSNIAENSIELNSIELNEINELDDISLRNHEKEEEEHEILPITIPFSNNNNNNEKEFEEHLNPKNQSNYLDEEEYTKLENRMFDLLSGTYDLIDQGLLSVAHNFLISEWENLIVDFNENPNTRNLQLQFTDKLESIQNMNYTEQSKFYMFLNELENFIVEIVV